MIAFFKKEILEQMRSGKLVFLSILFILFGIMNPAVAKMTPWLLEVMADSMAEGGMTITLGEVTAMDSWVQFFKNLPIVLIAFVLLQGSIFTREYSSGTLVLSLTKGLQRFKIIVAKSGILFSVWSIGYWICFIITYLYNSYFWDNSVAENLLLSVVCWWLFGVFVISLMTLFSTISISNTGVLLGTGAIVLISYMVGLLPKANKYLPTLLTDGNSLIYGMAQSKEYIAAIIITAIATIICFSVSIPIFNKKHL
jgi:ABC-2 type transport system permease protein